MPLFRYLAQDESGKEVKGELVSGSHYELANKLEEQGVFLISWKKVFSEAPVEEEISELKIKSRKIKSNKIESFLRTDNINLLFNKKIKISLKDLTVVTRQLVISVKSGITLTDSIHSITNQTENKNISKLFAEIGKKIEAGTTLSNALASYPDIFSLIYVNIIKAGESGGFLAEALEKLAVYLENQIETKNNIRNNLIYPVIVFSSSIAILGFMATFILPVFGEVFSSLGGELPGLTRTLMDSASFIRKNWLVELLTIILIIISIPKILKINRIKNIVDRKILDVPFIGDLIKKIAISRFIYTLSALLESGVPMLESLDISSEVTGNNAIEKEVNNLYKSIQAGHLLSEKMFSSKLFPTLIANMVATGENAGRLPEILNIVSSYYDKETDYAIKNLFVAMEPLLIIMMGGAVALLVIGMLMPVFNMATLIG